MSHALSTSLATPRDLLACKSKETEVLAFPIRGRGAECFWDEKKRDLRQNSRYQNAGVNYLEITYPSTCAGANLLRTNLRSSNVGVRLETRTLHETSIGFPHGRSITVEVISQGKDLWGSVNDNQAVFNGSASKLIRSSSTYVSAICTRN